MVDLLRRQGVWALLAVGLGPACGGRAALDGAPGEGGAAGLTSTSGGSPQSGGVEGAFGGSPAGGKMGAGGVALGGFTSGGATSGGATSGGAASGGSAPVPPLWRNSRVPFCQDDSDTGLHGVSASIWSDDRGVFLLVAEQFSTVHFNDGNGWKVFQRSTQRGSGPIAITGFPAGPILQYGALAGGCGIEIVEPSGVTCSAATPFVTKVHVVDSDLAYAVYGRRVLQFSGDQWFQFGDPLARMIPVFAQAIWASHRWVLVGADAETSFLLNAANSEDRTSTTGGAEIEYGAAWGFGEDSFWLGASDGRILQRTQGQWVTAWRHASSCAAIRGLWGMPEALYFWTRSFVGVLRAGKVDTVLSLPCDGSSTIEGVWGNSAREVFIVTRDQSLTSDRCGDIRAWWFNGSVLGSL